VLRIGEQEKAGQKIRPGWQIRPVQMQFSRSKTYIYVWCMVACMKPAQIQCKIYSVV
jgi:hypothetical protein